MNAEAKKLILYAAKCVTGALLVYGLGHWLHYTDIGWCLISVVLVLSPDEKDAMPLALGRMKGNFAGSAVSLACLLAGPPNVFTLCLGLVAAIVLCHFLKVMEGVRSALAAVAIILLHGQGRNFWSVSLERMIAVVGGCLLGLLITFAFHRAIGERSRAVHPGGE